MTHEKTILVTGTSSGVGQAAVHALAAAGFRVVAGVRKSADAERWRSRSPANVEPVCFDVRDARATRAAIAALGERLAGGGLYGLVNNAGVALPGPVEHATDEEIAEQLGVNVTGRLVVMQACIPLLRRARGRIVNIGSLNGAVASPFAGIYSASMHALDAINAALRVELQPCGIHVALCELPQVDTPIFDKGRRHLAAKLEAFDDQARARYGRRFERFVAATLAMRKDAAPMAAVTDAILHAFTSPRPKARYRIGLRAALGVRMARVMPEAWLDRAITHHLLDDGS